MSIRVLIRQDETWKAIDGITNCNMDCQYCFLKIYGTTPKMPEKVAEIDDVLDSLQSHHTYRKEELLMFGSETDIFMSYHSIQYYSELLKRYEEREIPNTVVFSTKCHIPDDFLELVKSLKTKVVFYLSYSGLPKEIEPRVNIKRLRDNFVRIKEHNLNVIHYWRPFLPQNSDEDSIKYIIEHVSQYADASVAIGLKVNKGIINNMKSFWPELDETDIDFSKTAGVWPKGVKDYLDKYIKSNYPNYPFYWLNSCAISKTLERPDILGNWDNNYCRCSTCPAEQREICKSFYKDYAPSKENIENTMKKLKLKREYKVNTKDKRVEIEGELSHSEVIFMRQSLGYQVHALGDYKTKNEWTGHALGRVDIEIPWHRNN